MKRVLKWLGRIALVLIGLLVVLLIAGFASQSIAEANDARAYPPPGQLVDVGGYRLHLYCTGEDKPGSPTVILDTMAGGSMVNWAWVQPEIARTTRVCSYDRASFGWSDASPNSPSLRQAADDLHALLTHANIAGPYVLVGHSMGGLIARQFAAEHPSDVAGVVLVDSSHPEQFERHPEYLDESKRMKGLIQAAPLLARFGLMRLYVQNNGFDFGGLPPRERAALAASWSAPKHWVAQSVEMSALESLYGQARSLGSLGDVPLVVITAGNNGSVGWNKLQAELATLSTNSAHRTVNSATHASLAFNQQHALQTSAAIRDVVEATRTGQLLAK
jgi:pimeloyl-ACP methyl ester carboxylesterase